jgi:hypothetical protein
VPDGALAAAESLYLDLRDLRDRIDVAGAAGRTAARDGTPVAGLARQHNRLRRGLITHLSGIDSSALATEDARAFRTMRVALDRDLAAVNGSAPGAPARPAVGPDCGYDPEAIAAARNGLDSLRRRI